MRWDQTHLNAQAQLQSKQKCGPFGKLWRFWQVTEGAVNLFLVPVVWEVLHLNAGDGSKLSRTPPAAQFGAISGAHIKVCVVLLVVSLVISLLENANLLILSATIRGI